MVSRIPNPEFYKFEIFMNFSSFEIVLMKKKSVLRIENSEFGIRETKW